MTVEDNFNYMMSVALSNAKQRSIQQNLDKIKTMLMIWTLF